jgi:DNA repair photolyase
MGLNKSKGNMYDFVTHTWNTVKGACSHDCSYCYMKRWGKLNPARFDEKELKTDLGEGNFIFVGSSCDMFAIDIPNIWIGETLHHCDQYKNQYLFQTKNPGNLLRNYERYYFPKGSVVCTTIESDSYYPEIMRNSPEPMDRSIAMQELSTFMKTYVTIEPVMDFNLEHMVKMIKRCNPTQVNIGADSGNHKLPEPSKEKILALIEALQEFTTIARKTNLARLLV